MKTFSTGCRFGVVLFFLLGILMSIGVPGAGAETTITCDDFTSTAPAQILLDADRSLQDALDPDGNGIACDEDAAGAGVDSAAYLTDLRAEIDGLWIEVDRFFEIGDLFVEASPTVHDGLRVEADAIALGWTTYPEVAAAFVAPAGYESIQETYLGAAEALADTGALWADLMAVRPGSDAEDAIFTAFDLRFTDAQRGLNETLVLVTAAISAPPAKHSIVLEPDAYLATVRAHADELAASADRMAEIMEDQSDVSAAVSILQLWEAAESQAYSLVAPEGYEDLQNAYEDVGTAYRFSYDAFVAWLDVDPDTAEGEELYADWQRSMDVTANLIEELDDELTAAGA